MLNDVDYTTCKTQGRIYEYIARQGMDVAAFSQQYLASDFCKRAMDTSYSRFQWADEEECLDFIFREFQAVKAQGGFDPAEAFWIGFTYRQLCMETRIPSKILAEEIPFERMRRMYPGMHTIDEDNVVEIIMQNHGWTAPPKYKKLEINYKLSEELEKAIDELMYEINNRDGLTEDCYRSEIDFWTKNDRKSLTDDQYHELRQYYVRGGIYKELGYPWDRKYTKQNN